MMYYCDGHLFDTHEKAVEFAKNRLREATFTPKNLDALIETKLPTRKVLHVQTNWTPPEFDVRRDKVTAHIRTIVTVTYASIISQTPRAKRFVIGKDPRGNYYLEEPEFFHVHVPITIEIIYDYDEKEPVI